MAGRIIVRDLIALDGNGTPYSGAKMYTYTTETTTNKATYTTEALSVAHPNPVVADSAGKFPDVWAALDSPFHIVIKNSSGSVTLYDGDPIYAMGATSNPAPRTITGTATLTSDDLNKTLRYTGSSSYTVTRPLGSTLTAGFKWRHAHEGTGTITLANSGADTADVSTLYPGDVVDEEWDGTTWQGNKLNSTGRHMLPVLAKAWTPQTTNGAALAIAELTTNKQMVASFDFDASTQEYVQFEIPMPKSADEGTITFRVRWSHGSTTVNFGVAWSLEAIAYSNDDAMDASWGTAVIVTDTGGTTNDLYITDESTAVTPAGTWAEGDTVRFRLSRVVANGSDTMAVDAKALSVDLFFNTNAPNDR
jgi:hypothetical protein